MSFIKRELVVDSDTGEQAELITFEMGKPSTLFTRSDVQELHAFLVSKSPPGQLKIAKSKMADLEAFVLDTPEYLSALRAIASAEKFAEMEQWERVSSALSEFSACYERSMRRVSLRREHDKKIAAGKKSGEARSQKALAASTPTKKLTVVQTSAVSTFDRSTSRPPCLVMPS